MATSPEVPYDITYAALLGILACASLPLFITACITIHRKGDTARLGLLWVKIAFGLLFVGTVLVTVETILIVLEVLDITESYYGDYKAVEAIDRLRDFGFFTIRIALLFIWLATIEIGLGILYCWNVAQRLRKFLQWPAYLFVLVEMALNIAYLAKYEQFWSDYYSYLRDESRTGTFGFEDLNVYLNIAVAFDFLLWIATLASVALTITLVILARKRADHRQASTLLLVASILSGVALTWSIATDAAWAIPRINSPGSWNLVVGPLLEFWTQFVALVLLFVIGHKKLGGLWSTAQGHLPANQFYGYGQPPMGQQQPYYPQQYGAPMYGQPQGYPPQPYGHTTQYQAGQAGWQQPVPVPQQHSDHPHDLPRSPDATHSELRGSEAATEIQSTNGSYQRREMK